ncbi:MAG TPA: ABC transporter permease [Caulobacteraceae bacterium]|jgi:ABC-2 type transport system permease protein|nr:ABC transporter permease [Caulobacteraceae bacterium]
MIGILRRIRAVAVVESLQLLYDPATLVLIFLLPVFQILLYGYAIHFEPRDVPVAIASSDADLSHAAAEALQGASLFHQVGPIGAPGSGRRAVTDRIAQVGVELARDPRTGAAQVQITADGSDPAEARPAVGVLETAIWQRIAETAALGQKPSVAIDWLYDPDNHATWRIAPGLIGVIVMISMLFLGALTLVRERERGSWETLLATPVRPAEALVGKLSPYLLIGLAQSAAMLGLIHTLFQVPTPPATWALVLVTVVFDAAYLLLGFAISAVVQTQLQAVQASVFIYLPSLLLSGFMFPFDGMPRWAQWIGEIFPLTHYIRATREVLLRGDSPASVIAHTTPMLVFAAIAFVAAVVLYRRRLD